MGDAQDKSRVNIRWKRARATKRADSKPHHEDKRSAVGKTPPKPEATCDAPQASRSGQPHHALVEPGASSGAQLADRQVYLINAQDEVAANCEGRRAAQPTAAITPGVLLRVPIM